MSIEKTGLYPLMLNEMSPMIYQRLISGIFLTLQITSEITFGIIESDDNLFLIIHRALAHEIVLECYYID